MGLSVLTLARDRRLHLRRLIEGLCRSNLVPDELIIVDMGGPAIAVPQSSFPVRILSLIGGHLPLAKARNFAASQARNQLLLFLDVDCIPMVGLLAAVQATLEGNDALLCAEIHYLKKAAMRDDWNEENLMRNSVTHPVRYFPKTGVRMESNPGLFWSLAFAIKASLFQTIGGFDERFTGYGAEDTDFGFRAQAAGVDLLFLGGAGAFHQYHERYDPPLQHFDDIIRNARIFHQIWGVWPMRGWLEAFERLKLIRLEDTELLEIRPPDAFEIESVKLS